MHTSMDSESTAAHVADSDSLTYNSFALLIATSPESDPNLYLVISNR